MTTAMELRARITVPSVPYDRPDLWEPLIERLERDAGQYGPVLTWTDDWDGLVVTMSADVPSNAHLAVDAVQKVARAIRLENLGDAYPSKIEIEPAEELR